MPGQLMNELDDVLEKQLDTNLYGVYYLTKGLYNLLKTSKGYIFNIASIASLDAYANGNSYAITKHALLGFSRGLRQESKEDGVRVTTVLPGATYTDSWKGVDIDPNRLMPASDIADIVFASYALSTRSVVEELVIRPLLGDL
jgi:short-subunit dehydrogenase